MAHHAKYNAQALGHMLEHYDNDRARQKRANVDPELTHLNYTMVTQNRENDHLTDKEFIEKRCNECEYRKTKQTVKMVDVVITVPKDYKGDIDKFFECCFCMMAKRYGEKNVVGGFVHMDEKDARPHMHFSFVPVYYDHEKNIDRLNAKNVVNRQDLRTFHKDLQKELDREKIPARVENGATKDLREQLEQERAKSEFYEREMQLTREQQARLNKYLEQQKEINRQYNREMLKEQEHDHKHHRNR